MWMAVETAYRWTGGSCGKKMEPPSGLPTPGINLRQDSRRSSIRKFLTNVKKVDRRKGFRSRGLVSGGTCTPWPKSHPRPRNARIISSGSYIQAGIGSCWSRAFSAAEDGASFVISPPIGGNFVSPTFSLPSFEKAKSKDFAIRNAAHKPDRGSCKLRQLWK